MKINLKKLLVGSAYFGNNTTIILEGDKSQNIPALLDYVYGETDGIEEIEEEESQKAWDSILSAMRFYIEDYPKANVYKQEMWRRFCGWLRNIAFDLEIEYDEAAVISEMPEPFTGDIDINILKDLHYDNKGVTKKELAAKYNVTERTIKEILKKLDRSEKGSEFRIAGQRVAIDLRHKDFREELEYGGFENRCRHFFSASTINPIFLQFNIAQVYSLINGLKCSYYQEERDMSISSGIEIWSQLSDYTKERIRGVYASKDIELKDFLDILDDELSTHKLEFRSEREQLKEDELSELERKEIYEKLRI